MRIIPAVVLVGIVAGIFILFLKDVINLPVMLAGYILATLGYRLFYKHTRAVVAKQLGYMRDPIVSVNTLIAEVDKVGLASVEALSAGNLGQLYEMTEWQSAVEQYRKLMEETPRFDYLLNGLKGLAVDALSKKLESTRAKILIIKFKNGQYHFVPLVYGGIYGKTRDLIKRVQSAQIPTTLLITTSGMHPAVKGILALLFVFVGVPFLVYLFFPILEQLGIV